MLLMHSKATISKQVLEDIAFRARLHISPEHHEDYQKSFTKIVGMLDSISNVSVCEFKGYANAPIACSNLRKDNPVTNMTEADFRLSCPYRNTESGVFEVPKVISEDN